MFGSVLSCLNMNVLSSCLGIIERLGLVIGVLLDFGNFSAIIASNIALNCLCPIPFLRSD